MRTRWIAVALVVVVAGTAMVASAADQTADRPRDRTDGERSEDQGVRGPRGNLRAKLQPGVDGVVLRLGQRQATYLPQVWEQLPTKEEFLAHLSVKAGLPPSAWEGPSVSILTYQVEAFEEPEN